MAVAPAGNLEKTLVIAAGGHRLVTQQQRPDQPTAAGVLDPDPPASPARSGTEGANIAAEIDQRRRNAARAQQRDRMIDGQALTDPPGVDTHARRRQAGHPVGNVHPAVINQRQQRFQFRQAVGGRRRAPGVKQRLDGQVKSPVAQAGDRRGLFQQRGGLG